MLGNKGTKKFYRSGGTRGGQDHFKWEDVKSDKDRENYLGHSLHAPVGRWQKGKDLLWYSRAKGGSNGPVDRRELMEDPNLEAERRRLKQMDEDILNAALGIKKQRAFTDNNTTHRLEKDELKQLIARGGAEQYRAETAALGSSSTTAGTDGAAADAEDIHAERIKGLGAAPAKFHDHIERISQLERQIERLKAGQKQYTEYDNVIHQLPGSAVSNIVDSAESKYDDGIVSHRHIDGGNAVKDDNVSSDNESTSQHDDEARRQRKEEKKREKRERKEKKRRRKEEKRQLKAQQKSSETRTDEKRSKIDAPEKDRHSADTSNHRYGHKHEYRKRSPVAYEDSDTDRRKRYRTNSRDRISRRDRTRSESRSRSGSRDRDRHRR